MILIPCNEVPHLAAAYNARLASLRSELELNPPPEVEEWLHDEIKVLEGRLDRVTKAYRVWEGTDANWCALIREVADHADNKTATPAGRNSAFSDVRNRMDEELTP